MGDLSPFSDLVPSNCTFINCPRTTGMGGGLASVFKSSFGCQSVKTETFSSFEVQMFYLKKDKNLLIAVVYCPPKPNKDFTNEFANFLGGIVTQFDRHLIVVDFNIHVCCDTNPLAKDFTSLIDSFDLVQMVKGPTHSLGHTLDLVLVYGHSICDLEICELSFSDHKPVMFTCSLSGQSSKRHQPVLRSRIFSPTVNEDLSAHFNEAYQLYSLDPSFNN